MKRMSPRQLNYKVIEAELYNYHSNKEEFNRLRQQIFDESGNGDGIKVKGAISNPTAKKVFALSSAVLLEVERRLRAIDYVLRLLSKHEESGKAELVRMKYFERELTDQGIQMRLNISQSTFTRWKRDVIELIAERLGYLV